MRAVSFSSTMASAVFGGTWASSSAVFRSSSEMKGAPPASSVLAWDFTEAGTAEFCSMPVRNDVVRVAMTIAPVSAVPMEIPRFVIVFWSPPTSPLCSSGTEDTVTLPSCDARAPIPRPASSMGQVVISAPAPWSSAATMTTSPAKSATKPSRATRRGDASGKSLGMPAAARMSVIESGRSRTPVSIAESPSATERNSGTAKKSPPCRKYWKKNEVRPPRSSGTRRILGSMRGSEPRVTRRFSHADECKQHDTAAEHQPDARRQTEPFRRVRAWAVRTPTSPSAGPRTRSARGRPPTARSPPDRAALPSRAAPRPCGGRGRGSRATTTTSPANT